jgi:hypothetical protein
LPVYLGMMPHSEVLKKGSACNRKPIQIAAIKRKVFLIAKTSRLDFILQNK